MSLAAVTFWDVVWWIIIATFAVMFIWLFIGLFADVLGRSDLSGGGKAGWILLFIIFPFVGCLIYLVARPDRAVTQPEVCEMSSSVGGLVVVAFMTMSPANYPPQKPRHAKIDEGRGPPGANGAAD